MRVCERAHADLENVQLIKCREETLSQSCARSLCVSVVLIFFLVCVLCDPSFVYCEGLFLENIVTYTGRAHRAQRTHTLRKRYNFCEI